jgi:hypothetical protein
MRPCVFIVALSMPLLLSPRVSAQDTDASGHWEGAIHAPSGDVDVRLDLSRGDDGKLMGTFSNPGEQIRGLPIWAVESTNRSVRLAIQAGAGVQTFKGEISADGTKMSGDFLISVYAVSFDVKRTGPARFEPPPSSAAIAAALEGVWIGTLDIDGRELEIRLSMTNRPDGTAIGTWGTNPGVQIPISIAGRGAEVSLTSTVSRGSYTGTVDDRSSTIVGTFTEGALTAPLTFRRADKN